MPEPGHNEVLVKVEAVGICAGDAKTYAGATRFWGQHFERAEISINTTLR